MAALVWPWGVGYDGVEALGGSLVGSGGGAHSLGCGVIVS